MLNKEVIQRVQSLYSKGVQSDDTRLSDRHIYNKLLTNRAKILRQQLNKKQKSAEVTYQVLPCVELIEAPIHECECIPDFKYIYRTKHKIPAVLSSNYRHAFSSITSLDGQTVFGESTWETMKYQKYEKFTSKKADFIYHNDYLYVTCKNKLKVITVKAIFDEPITATNFPSFCDVTINPCGDEIPCQDCQDCTSVLDLEFPLDADNIDKVITTSLQELIQVFVNNIEDKTNNTRDNEQAK